MKNLLREPFFRRGAALFVAVVCLFFLAQSDILHGAIVAAVAWSQPFIEESSLLGMLIFVLLSALSAMLAFFSSAIVVPLALQVWGKPVTVLLLWMGWLVGGVCSYFIGKYPGRKLLGWAVPAKKVEQLEGALLQNARLPLIFLLQMALPSEVPGYLLGALKYPLRYYLLVLSLAELPFVVGTVYLGEGFLERDYLILGVVGVVGVIFSSLTTYLLYKKLKGQAISSLR